MFNSERPNVGSVVQTIINQAANRSSMSRDAQEFVSAGSEILANVGQNLQSPSVNVLGCGGDIDTEITTPVSAVESTSDIIDSSTSRVDFNELAHEMRELRSLFIQQTVEFQELRAASEIAREESRRWLNINSFFLELMNYLTAWLASHPYITTGVGLSVIAAILARYMPRSSTFTTSGIATQAVLSGAPTLTLREAFKRAFFEWFKSQLQRYDTR